MAVQEQLMGVTTISGDREIARILKEQAVFAMPAFACHYDGFANDVSSEYANPSIVRPRSVRNANLSSTLTAYFYREDADTSAPGQPINEQSLLDFTAARFLPEYTNYYIGWTMYDEAGFDENVTAWIGANKVAYVQSPDNDNRVHLYILNEPFYFDEGERLRLVTDANDGPYRIENIFLFRTLPQAKTSKLSLSAIAAELDEDTNGERVVRLNWRTSRPTNCKVVYGHGQETPTEVSEGKLLANHCVVLQGVEVSAEPWFAIRGEMESGETVETGKLRLIDYLPQGSGKAQAGRLSFTVTNQLELAVAAWPLTCGIPLPRSVLWDLNQCRLLGKDGVAIPSQKRVQVSWDDGSIRWALFDFQINLAAAGEEEIVLEYGPEVSDEPLSQGINVVSTAQEVVIDAQLLRMTFSHQHYAFPAKVEVRHGDKFEPAIGFEQGLSAIELVNADGKRFDASGEVEEISVEEPGPLRVTVRALVKHRSPGGDTLFRSVVRVSAYLGKPFLRVQHTFENDNTDSLFTQVRSLTLGANIAADRLEEVWSGDSPVQLAKGAVRTFQPSDDSFSIRQAGTILQEGEHAANWLAVSGPAGTVAITMRDFWENYPKAWQATQGPSGRGITIDICPDISAISYPKGKLDEVRAYFYLQYGQYKFKRGMARTHDMLFVFSNAREVPQDAIRLFNEPPLIRLEPEALESSGILSALCRRGQAGAEEYDAWTERTLDIFEQDRQQTRAYGLLNFGDWYGERQYNWGNMEYDTPYAFLLEYLRGGPGRYFTLGWQAAWHLIDVDTCHYHPEPNKAGRQILHSLGHVGDYYPDGYLAGAIEREMMDWTHIWIEGLYLYALLTGERRLWEAATRAVQLLAEADLNDYDFTNCRDCGWPLRHLVGAYQATGRKQFLNGASIIVERVLERQRSTGGWERLMVVGHCFHVPPRHMGNAGFMVGVLLAALKRYHEATQDPAVGNAIVNAARYLMRSMWEPKYNAFRYTSCPESKTAGELNAQILEGIGYAWRLSGDGELGAALLAGLEACLTTPHLSTTPPDGKDISSRMRSMPYIMYDVVNVTQ